MWCGFKFTQARKVGQHTGWEATCYAAHHSDNRACTRTLTFNTPANQELCLRRLRWWCMAGDQCTDRQSHQKLPYNGPGNHIAQLPSIYELEAMGGRGSGARFKQRRSQQAAEGCLIV